MRNSTGNKIQITGSTGVSFGNVSQSISTGELDPQSETEKVVKVLFMGANPSGTEQLRLDREAKAIADVLKVGETASRFQLEQSWAATVHDMQDGLLRCKPDIIHLSGHGRTDGLLVLETDSVTRDLQSTSWAEPHQQSYLHSLGRLFAVAGGRIRCVVLNACHSADAARVIADHVDCVVGMSDSIGDEAAILFSRGFYHALGQGQSVRTAFEFGTAQIGLSGVPGAKIPILLGGRSDPDAVSFVPKAAF